MFMGALGIIASFFSHEILGFVGATIETQAVVIVQILGAMYLGFAFLNWYLRGFVIGGIYNRPLGVANTLHFAIVSVILVKLSLAVESAVLWSVTVIYVIFAAWFALVLFGQPPALRNSRTGYP